MIMSLIEECTRRNIKSFMKLYRKMYDDEKSTDAKIRGYIENDLSELFDILIYVEDSKMVGCIYIEKTHSFAEKEYDEYIFYISNLYVLEEYRRRGIANKLLERVERIAKGNNIKIIASDYKTNNNESALLHKNNGFVEISRTIQVVKDLEEA